LPRRPPTVAEAPAGPQGTFPLEARQRFWPKRMEFARRRRVEAYWNGLVWIA
jgi:hypothetical protein